MGENNATILSYENILGFIANKIDVEFNIEHFEISDDFPFKFVLKGEQWNDAFKDGYIDYRAANILLSLQRDIFELYNGATGDSVNFKNNYGTIKDVTVRVKIKDGSLSLETCKDSIKALISKVGSWQATGIITLGMTLAFGYFTVESYNKRVVEEAKILNSTKQAEIFQKISKDALAVAEKSQETLKTIVSYMKPSDVLLQEHIRSEPLTKQDLQGYIIEKQSTDLEESFRVDDRFKVTVLNIKSNSVQIQRGPFRYFATTKLMSEEDKRELFNTARDASIEERIPEYDLQTSVVTKDGKVHEVYLIAIGKPRNDAISTFDLPQKIKFDVQQNEQLQLPIVADKP